MGAITREGGSMDLLLSLIIGFGCLWLCLRLISEAIHRRNVQQASIHCLDRSRICTDRMALLRRQWAQNAGISSPRKRPGTTSGPRGTKLKDDRAPRQP